MYGLAIMLSIALTILSVWFVKLLEGKVGAHAEKRIGLSFSAPVFILYISAGSYMIYINAATGSFFLLSALLVTAVVSSYQDLKYSEIEDEIHLAALSAGLIGLIIKGFHPMDSFLGFFFGGGSLLFVSILSKGGMGGADIKLNAVYGAILGLKLSVLSLLIAFTVGALASLLLILFRIKRRKDFIPFSPFLSIGALTSFMFGIDIINRYIDFIKG